jgi:hypothetical protein
MAFSGCIGDIWDQLTAPDADVSVSAFDDGWNRDNRFLVLVSHSSPLSIRITADGDGHHEWDIPAASSKFDNGTYENKLEAIIPDGEWSINYYIDGHKWNQFNIMIDTIAPEITGLELLGNAVDGAYTIGVGATYSEAISVKKQSSGAVISRELPVLISGLTEGVTSYDVSAVDEAGNQKHYTVQIRAGDAQFLPSSGEYDFGIIARYTTTANIWDITDLSIYASNPEAWGDKPEYLGSGFGIEPGHPTIKAIVDAETEPGMNTMQTAWALYKWMFEELEYTEERLAQSDLLDAHETIENGGGVCRDLAALYVSLLRAADVPSRLVTGYLAGEVNGFHAWVEIYAPSPGQESWVPVDVSPIDGPFEIKRALGSFAISRPDYLPLAAIDPENEVEGWSTAIGVQYSYTGEPPTRDFGKTLDIGFTVDRKLCLNVDTLARAAQTDCDGFTHVQSEFPTRMEQTLDYGISVSPGANVEVTIAYPTAYRANVEYVVYGQEWERQGLFVTAEYKS